MEILTPYDEYPVHQAPHPFSRMPASDLNWDDGYYFGVYSASEQVFLYTGMRVTPNADVIGTYAGVSVAGRQTTVRSSRIWRPDFSTAVAPLHYEFAEPFRDIWLRLDENESGLQFDIRWQGLADPHVEAHHFAQNRGRVTTDQTRYAQAGTAEGWIEIDGRRYEVRPGEWYADRDHSWGLYEPREPLSNPTEWLPPREEPERKRMFRFWMPFQTPEFTGFYHFHEDEHGSQLRLNDVFGTPFEGAVDFGLDDERPRLKLVEGRHELRFLPGTRVISGGTVELLDERGRTWHQEFEVPCPPWTTFPIGYYQGTWRDGGNIHTYHPSDGDDPYVEWDVVDFSEQPADYHSYGGRVYRGVFGAEYVVRTRIEGPEGTAEGLGHIEFFMHRAYGRYRPQDET